jgi:Skp family chaperone for outer membrane proteins
MIGRKPLQIKIPIQNKYFPMKKIITICLSTLLLTAACRGKTEAKKEENTKPTVPVIRTNGLKIAYYDQDSLKLQYEYFVKMEKISMKKQQTIQAQLINKERDLQNYINTNEQLVQQKQLSDMQIQEAQMEVQRRNQELYQLQQTQGAKLESETVNLLNMLGKKIEDAGKKYCEEHKIDILLVKSPGSQYNYINPSMNVTKEFIAFLNQKYGK